jgi:RHS repeat-associated protein
VFIQFLASYDVLAYNNWNAYPIVFHGTLLTDKKDRTGTFYRRNRTYDPMTGRFTQEDPIGLGGGANLYGFAAGDPVNFSDPFGLCPYEGTVRTRTTSDCLDKRLGRAFALLMKSKLGRAYVDYWINHPNIELKGHKGPMNCGGKQADGCQTDVAGTEVNTSRSTVDLAGIVVHETTHWMNFTASLDVPALGLSFYWNEATAYAAQLTYLGSTLSPRQRSQSIWGPTAQQFLIAPAQTIQQICLDHYGAAWCAH